MGKFLLTLAVDLVQCVLTGITLKLLWGWYIVTAFNLPALSIAQAIGVAFIVSLLSAQHIPRDEEKIVEMVVFNLTLPPIMLAFGWGFHFFL